MDLDRIPYRYPHGDIAELMVSRMLKMLVVNNSNHKDEVDNMKIDNILWIP